MRIRLATFILTALTGIALSGLAAPMASASTTPSSSTGSQIAIPMTAVPHKARPGTVSPKISIPGSCGTAFLYPSAASGHVHYDFGFKNISTIPVWVTAHVSAQNIDNTLVDNNSWSGPYVSRTWEKQGNLYTGYGENLVTGYIYIVGVFYDCVSSPNLAQWIYIY